jgi:flagellin
MRINHNIAALNTYRQLGNANNAQMKSMEKLSSGLRINRAGDDAAGLAISEKMRGQIRGLDMAAKNAQDGISLIQTAEGALNETHAILQRMRELAVQSANDTNNDVDRKELQKEFNQLIDEIDRISNNTEFNTKTLLDGSFTGKFHIGANEGQSIELSITSMGASNLGQSKGLQYSIDSGIDISETSAGSGKFTLSTGAITIKGQEYTLDNTTEFDSKEAALADFNNKISASGLETKLEADGSITLISKSEFEIGESGSESTATSSEVTSGDLINSLKVDTDTATSGGILTQADADKAITSVNNAIEKVSAERSKLGAYQNRLEHTINNLGTSSENLTAAESRIRDVDMAKEMMEQTKNAILAQASQAMLAQANQLPQGVLQLLR